LRQYGGFDYLRDHWRALHIQNPFWVGREMFAVCPKFSGSRYYGKGGGVSQNRGISEILQRTSDQNIKIVI
jgi:hypothetical protein